MIASTTGGATLTPLTQHVVIARNRARLYAVERSSTLTVLGESEADSVTRREADERRPRHAQWCDGKLAVIAIRDWTTLLRIDDLHHGEVRKTMKDSGASIIGHALFARPGHDTLGASPLFVDLYTPDLLAFCHPMSRPRYLLRR